MIPLFAFLLVVNGTVINRTTAKPQPGATVTLYKLGQGGPEALKSVKSDASGKFEIDENPTGPHLLQAAFDGVTYNHMLPPGKPSTGVTVDVYHATRSRGGAKVTTHMILVEPGDSEIAVNESIIWRNEGKTAFNDPDNGTLRIFLPAGTGGKAKIMATAPQGMPIERAPEKTAAAGVYKIDFPIKPGETRFDISYAIPGATPSRLSGKVLHGGGPVRAVAPLGVTLAGDSVKMLGQEPATQASVYEITDPSSFSLEVQGTGSLRAPETESSDNDDEGSGFRQIRPRIYDRFHAVLALAFLILTLGLILLYRKRA